MIATLAREHEVLIMLEEGAAGGFGAHVLQYLSTGGYLDGGLKVRSLVMPDVYMDQAGLPRMYAQAGLDKAGIVRTALTALGLDKAKPLNLRA